MIRMYNYAQVLDSILTVSATGMSKEKVWKATWHPDLFPLYLPDSNQADSQLIVRLIWLEHLLELTHETVYLADQLKQIRQRQTKPI